MRRGHGGATVTLLALAALGLEALGLSGGAASALAVTGLLGVVALLVVLRASLEVVGIGAAIGAAFFTSWNGWLVGPIRPGDLLIFVAFACLAATKTRTTLPTVPWWIVQAGFVIGLVAILHVVLPTDPDYLAARTVLDAAGRPFVEFQTNFGVAVKFIVGIVLLPLVFTLAAQSDARAVHRIAAAFALGTGVSGFVAFVDGRGLTHLGQTVTGVYFAPAREGGFANHANFLATACVLAIPIAFWLLASPVARNRLLGTFAFPACVLGVYATGSRGGAVGAVVAVALSLALTPRVRALLPSIGFVLVLGAAAAFVASPALGQSLLRATRLGGGTTETSGSDFVRSLVGHQGVLDFRHSPLDGIGLEVAAQAQNVYLQELAAGGVLLFGAMLVFVLGSLRETLRLFDYDDLARALFVAILASVALNFAEADLTDRYYYVPAGLAAAMIYQQRRVASAPTNPGRPAPQPAEPVAV